MFEKEAIRHAFECTIGVECLNKPIEDFTYEELSDEQQEKAYDFKKGAEFGYNKANEWHDLRKDPNDLPDIHCLNWVIALYDNGTLWCRAKREKCVDGIFWVDSYHYQIYNVIAWKEIVFSKEIKEND